MSGNNNKHIDDAPFVNDGTVKLTSKQQKAENMYQSYLELSKDKDYSSIEKLNILYLAGHDIYGRRVAVLEAANLPAKTIDLKLLLLYFISIMDPIVNENYALIFLGTNISSNNRPPMDWLSTAYTMFNRKYKKNLKALYIVHPGKWVKLTLKLVKPFISEKFWRKVAYIENLHDIYNYIDKSQVTFPNYVIRYNAKVSLPTKIFGSSIRIILQLEDNLDGIPHVLTDCVNYLRNYIQVEGIFRKAGPTKQISQLQEAYNFGEQVNLQTIEDPHVVAGLFKRFFRDLPDPLFPFEYYDILLQFYRLLAKDNKDIWIIKTNGVLKTFPEEHLRVMKLLFSFIGEVCEYSEENLMNPNNLATVFGPNIIQSTQNPQDLNELLEANSIIELFIIHHKELIPI